MPLGCMVYRIPGCALNLEMYLLFLSMWFRGVLHAHGPASIARLMLFRMSLCCCRCSGCEACKRRTHCIPSRGRLCAGRRELAADSLQLWACQGVTAGICDSQPCTEMLLAVQRGRCCSLQIASLPQVYTLQCRTSGCCLESSGRGLPRSGLHSPRKPMS